MHYCASLKLIRDRFVVYRVRRFLSGWELCALLGFYVKYLNRVVVEKEFGGFMTSMQNGSVADLSLVPALI